MKKNKLILRISLMLAMIIVSGCTFFANKYYDDLFGEPQVQDRLVSANTESGDFYLHQVKPILDNRCVVCHGCYDASCQLKLSSPDGIDRGISKEIVYNTGRLKAAQPSQLFEDETTTQGWRQRGFSPVLNERIQTNVANLQGGVMSQSLMLKRQYPLPEEAILNKAFSIGLNHKQECPGISEWDRFANKHPFWGMPYALPGLNASEFGTMQSWLGKGAKMAHMSEPGEPYQSEIEKWERFLNGDGLKQRLMTRYIYEHWFLAHLYFKQLPGRVFFKLVRSRTPSGQPIDRIVTRRPYDDPGTDRVYYRLWRDPQTVIAKTHVPYALDDERLEWLTTLFLNTDYQVTSLPGHDPQTAGNPFIAFSQIPVSSRWRFILEEAQFTIMNFIKGPVCRGQVALNVINDHFWVFFLNPDLVEEFDKDQFFIENGDSLRMPNEEQSDVKPLKTWLSYSKSQQAYLAAKSAWLDQNLDESLLNLNLVWDGDAENKNAALTIFRHFDSATVIKGMVGRKPKTAWIISYSLLERIHYLLVAGYDVYGNLGHQLTTRLYMDFLRMEGEFNFLTLLPEQRRTEIRDQWYKGANENVKQYVYGSHTNFDKQSTIDYQTDDVKSELFEMIKTRLAAVSDQRYIMDESEIPALQMKQLKRFDEKQGLFASILPQTVFLTVISPGSTPNYYTLIHNNVHSNITSLFKESKNREIEKDYVTVVPGFVGDYPNSFWQVDESDLTSMVDQVLLLKTPQDYQTLMDDYAIRRTNYDFWQKSDELQQANLKRNSIGAGLFDYNRLENR